MKGLRSILGDSVKQAGGQRRAEEKACLELWPQVVGESIAEATRAERFRDGILFVNTKHSVWSCELNLVKDGIITALNEKLGRELVRDLRFKVGSLTPAILSDPENGENAPEKSAANPVQVQESMLTERSRAQVEQAIASIKNDLVRERTRSMLVKEAYKREQRQKQGWKECPRCGTLHPEGHRLCPLCRLHIRT